MTTSNLSEWWSVMKKGGLLKSGVGDAQFDELSGYVKMKTEIAEFMWYALTGVLTTSISYNAILNAGCEQSVKEMEKRHAQYLEQESNIAKAKQQKEGSQMVYKSYE
jgi:predicted SAM-dependent methyltransferase